MIIVMFFMTIGMLAMAVIFSMPIGMLLMSIMFCMSIRLMFDMHIVFFMMLWLVVLLWLVDNISGFIIYHNEFISGKVVEVDLVVHVVVV